MDHDIHTYADFVYGIRHPYESHSHYPRFTCCAVLVLLLHDLIRYFWIRLGPCRENLSRESWAILTQWRFADSEKMPGPWKIAITSSWGMMHDVSRPIHSSREPQQGATNQVQRNQLRGESGDGLNAPAWTHIRNCFISTLSRHSFCKSTYWQHKATTLDASMRITLALSSHGHSLGSHCR